MKSGWLETCEIVRLVALRCAECRRQMMVSIAAAVIVGGLVCSASSANAATSDGNGDPAQASSTTSQAYGPTDSDIDNADPGDFQVASAAEEDLIQVRLSADTKWVAN